MDADKIVIEVCYRFSSNELLTEEAFQVDSGQITLSSQQQIAEDCGDFKPDES